MYVNSSFSLIISILIFFLKLFIAFSHCKGGMNSIRKKNINNNTPLSPYFLYASILDNRITIKVLFILGHLVSFIDLWIAMALSKNQEISNIISPMIKGLPMIQITSVSLLEERVYNKIWVSNLWFEWGGILRSEEEEKAGNLIGLASHREEN